MSEDSIEKAFETTTNQNESEGGKTMNCPRCNAEIDHLVIKGRMAAASCPNCKQLIGKPDKYPDMPVEHVEAKAKSKPRTPRTTERGRERVEDKRSEIEDEEGVSLFERPRESWEIVEEILNEFGIKEDFIDIIVRRARRQGGIHPTELFTYLSDFATGMTGLKDKRTARFIVDEYEVALRAEEDKARDEGRRWTSPIGLRSERNYNRPSYGVGRRTYSDDDYGGRYDRGYDERGRGREPLTEDRLTEIMDRRERQSREKDELDDLRKRQVESDKDLIRLEHRIEDTKKDIETVVSSKFDELKELFRGRKGDESEPGTITKKDLDHMVTIQEKNMEGIKKEFELTRKDEVLQRVEGELKSIRESGLTGRTQYDLGTEIVKGAKEVLSDFKGTAKGLIRAVKGEAEEAPKGRKETEGEGVAEQLEKEGKSEYVEEE